MSRVTVKLAISISGTSIVERCETKPRRSYPSRPNIHSISGIGVVDVVPVNGLPAFNDSDSDCVELESTGETASVSAGTFSVSGVELESGAAEYTDVEKQPNAGMVGGNT